MKNLIKALIKINDKLYEVVMNENYKYQWNLKKMKSFQYFKNWHYDRSQFNKWSEQAFNYWDSLLMKLNSTQYKKEENFKVKQRNQKNKTCYLCDKSDHFAWSCYNKDVIFI